MASRPRPLRKRRQGVGDAAPALAASSGNKRARLPTDETTRTSKTADRSLRAVSNAPTPPNKTPRMPSFQELVAGAAAPAANNTQVLVARADRLIADGRDADAVPVLQRAMMLCACHHEVLRQLQALGAPAAALDPVAPCACRDFVLAAQTRRPAFGALLSQPGATPVFPIAQLDREAVYALATDGRPCTCGSGRIRCQREDHLGALDRLAVVAHRLGRLELCGRLGQWYIDLAPHQPQGYLHTARAVIAQAAARTAAKEARDDADAVPPNARFVARCIYTHGSHNVRTHGDRASPLLKVLDACSRSCSRADYLPSLPIEVAEAIFRHLSMNDLLSVVSFFLFFLFRPPLPLPPFVPSLLSSPPSFLLFSLF